MPAGPAGAACSSAASCGWMSRAACLGEDPELFFPVAATGRALPQISSAKRVCRRCTVRAGWLTCAGQARQSGLWGRTTFEERFAVREPSAGAASRPAAMATPAFRNPSIRLPVDPHGR